MSPKTQFRNLNSHLRGLLAATVAVLLMSVMGNPARADEFNILWWDSTPQYGTQALDSYRQEMSDYLTNFGGGGVFNSTYVSSETAGTFAAHMASHSYDVIVFDATSSDAKFNADDLDAVKAFYAANSNLLLDGTLYIRSIDYNSTTDFPGTNGGTGGLTVNEVHQLAVRGGGIMIGTDHDCCQTDANQVLGAVVPGAAFTGLTIPSTDGAFFGTDLLNSITAVTPLDIFNHWDSVPSQAIAPTGAFADFLGNSVTLYTQVEAADDPGGGTRFPYISSSWKPGDEIIDIDDPEPPDPNNPVPEPATMILLGSGLAGLAAKLRRRKTGESKQN